jgi:signal transduction histidine kinase
MSEPHQPQPLKRTLIEQQPLSVSARVAMQLGRESISSSITAILELVKNAYDADATRIRIRFQRLGEEYARLIIEDDGRGMTLSQLRDHWMVIGTANKATVRKTKKGRTPTGEKGLGRLGLDRLCSVTRVQTKSHNSSPVELEIDWSSYERATSRLEEVVHSIYTLTDIETDPISGKQANFPHGTRLVLQGLKDEWSVEALGELRSELALLVSPFAAPNDFTIELDSGRNNDKLDGVVKLPDFVLESANWKVTATIRPSANSTANVEIRMQSAQHETEYHLKPVPWKEWVRDGSELPLCGPLEMEFYYFPREKTFAGEKILTKADVVQFLEANQGMRIYRDGFRVKPYGQPNGEGDWLRFAFLKARSPEGPAQKGTVGAWRVSYHQIVGAVFLKHEANPALSDQTNREGLVEGKAFAHLRTFATKVVRFFELSHQKYAQSQKPDEPTASDAEKKAKASVAASDDALKQLSEVLGQISPTPQTSQPLAAMPKEVVDAVTKTQALIAKVRSTAVESAEAMAVEKAQVEKQKNMLSNLASLGILAAAFGHESVDWAGNIVKLAVQLDEDVIAKAWWLAEAERPVVQQKMKLLVSESKKLRKFAQFTLGNITRDKRAKKKDVCLRRSLDTVFSAFREVLEGEKKIRAEYPKDGDYYVEGYTMDWESIFVNLIINASWAMETSPADERRIRVEIRTEDGFHIVQFDDAGRGLEAGTEEVIFEPTFTTKRNERGEEIGTGLGLTIVRAFVEEHSQGKVTAKQKGALGGASFIIAVPVSPKSPKENTP